MEIRQLLQTVRANWVVALVTLLVCLLLGAAYAVLPAKTYSASVVLLAQPPAGATDPGADVSAIQIEIPQITVEAENPAIDAEARSQIPAHFQSTVVTIAATADPTTNSVTITASSTDPAAAQAFANATAARVVKVVRGRALRRNELYRLSTSGIAWRRRPEPEGHGHGANSTPDPSLCLLHLRFPLLAEKQVSAMALHGHPLAE